MNRREANANQKDVQEVFCEQTGLTLVSSTIEQVDGFVIIDEEYDDEPT